MKVIVPILLWGLVSAGIVAGESYGIEQFGNLALGTVWFFSLVGLISCFVLDDAALLRCVQKSKLHRYTARTIYGITFLIMIAYGWFFTAILSLFSRLLLNAVQASAKSKHKED